MLFPIIIITLLQSSMVTSREILEDSSLSTTDKKCDCSEIKDELIKAENDMDDLKLECNEEFYTFSQTLVEEPKLWTKSNFCSKKSIKTVTIRLRYLADLTRKIKEHCESYRGRVHQCPNGWRHHENSCYLFVNERKTWFQARDHCKTLNAHLVIVEGQREDHFLRTTLINIHGNDIFHTLYFTGGLYTVSGWVWIKTRQSISYNNWCPGRPRVFYFKDCLAYDGWCGFGWMDFSCWSKQYFICEKQAVY